MKTYANVFISVLIVLLALSGPVFGAYWKLAPNTGPDKASKTIKTEINTLA
jgi:hypothetical protein